MQLDRNSELQEIYAEVRRFADTATDLTALQNLCVNQIAGLPRYDWVGFYMLDSGDAGVLVLGPFRGAPTPHVRIPVTEGICGAAVADGTTIVVEDVRTDPRYLACSLETQSEIVTPIRVNGVTVGEIDVDSHTPNAFSGEDRKFLEHCASIIGEFIAAHRR